jgi:hypothetical protein
MGGGAWPFLVGEVTCLVNSDNGRDLDLLNMVQKFVFVTILSRTLESNSKEVRAYNRSVMPLDGLGCTCATLKATASVATVVLLRSQKAFILGIGACNYSP